MKHEGQLIMTQDSSNGEYRLDIRFPDGSNYGGLHCGDCLEVAGYTTRMSPIWKSTRVECAVNGEWYLVDLYKPGEIPHGLTVRI